MAESDLKEAIVKIPEKSKEYFKQMKKTWDILSTKEKAGVVALAILTHPAISFGLMEYWRRGKLEEVS